MIRIAIVEDSRTARRFLADLYRSDPEFEVVLEAGSAAEAIAQVPRLSVDVVSLDVFLEDANAAAVVRAVLAQSLVPVVLVSGAPRTAPEVFEALAAGALDLVNKPVKGSPDDGRAFLQLVKMLSRVRVRAPRGGGKAKSSVASGPLELLLIAASTGGPVAVRELLAELPASHPPVVVAQHLAVGFETALARWLAESTGRSVEVAAEGQPAKDGAVWLIPPGHDGRLDAQRRIQLSVASPRGYHPSADILFSSGAEVASGTVGAVVLSGIGEDGLVGARRVVEAGGLVLAQDQRSSAVYGMPGAVSKAGLCSFIAPAAHLGRHLATLFRGGGR